MQDENGKTAALGDAFDRMMRSLDGLPDTASTKLASIDVTVKLLGVSQQWTVRTFRRAERDEEGAVRKTYDTVFLTCIDQTGGRRSVIPPEVADAIARQRDALTTKSRKRGAVQAAQTREARGIKPAFLKKKGK